ncbi:DUF4244 domain-containing protein [Myceligenerans indicum]|nr:DUF4244 domain-containing protein [Myceligenerans indicum]
MTHAKATTVTASGGTAGRRRPGRDHEAGMATAEYAIATLGAAGFAGILMVVLKGGDVKSLLTSLITTALSAG